MDPTAMDSIAENSNKFQDDLMPLYLSCIAGASTCIGAAIVFLYPKGQRVGPGTMSFSLALAGSVMVTVSAISIGPESMHDSSSGEWISIFSVPFLLRVSSFAVGCLVYFAISWCALPEPDELLREGGGGGDIAMVASDNGSGGTDLEDAMPLMRSNSRGSSDGSDDDSGGAKHSTAKVRIRKQSSNVTSSETSSETPPQDSSNAATVTSWAGTELKTKDQKKAWRIAILLFISLLIHNFPEGLAVAASAVRSESLGLTVTIGIMIHNIPEGIAIAVPCLAARPNQPWLAFVLASVSGLAEPLGAFVALVFLKKFVQTDQVEPGILSSIFCLENVLSFVAGVMVTVAVYELFPEAWRQRKGNNSSYFWWGTLSGFLIMVVTELYIDV